MVIQEPYRVGAARRRIGRTEAEGALDALSEVLCEPARRRIVVALSEAELPVGDLAAAIDRKVPATPPHLRVLRELGIVEGERGASHVYYRIRPGPTVERIRRLFRTGAGRAGLGRTGAPRHGRAGRGG